MALRGEPRSGPGRAGRDPAMGRRPGTGGRMNPDGPQQSSADVLREVMTDLWGLRRAQPARPVGTDPDYQPPARWYLGPLTTALAQVEAAVAQALSEVPPGLQRHAQQQIRQHGPDWSALAEREPVLRRFWQVCRARDVLAAVLEDLANEGRPQPAP